MREQRGAEPERPWLQAYLPGVRPQLEHQPRPLQSLLDDASARFGRHRFLDFLGRGWSYEEIDQLAARAARGLQTLGVQPGTRVGILLPNCPYTVIVFFAVLRAGGIAVNLNPLYAPRELELQVAGTGAEIVVTLDLDILLPKATALLGSTSLRSIVVCRMADILPFPKNLLFPWIKRGALARGARPGSVCFHDLIANNGNFEPVPVDPVHDIAVLQYTGGTTGSPKAAALSHAGLYANARQLQAWYPDAERGGERILGVLPLFHVFAMTAVLNYATTIGAEVVLVPRFELPQMLRLIDRRRPTLVPGVPTMYAAIRNHPSLSRFDLSSIRLCISGGAPLPLEVKDSFEILTGCTVVEGYGLTEAPVVTCNPIGGPARQGSIGVPLPGTVVEVVSLEDRESLLPAGATGELCVRGPQVMAGYWQHPDGSAEVLRDGRLHTGDIGHLDEDGFCFVVDRLKDVILCSGYAVYPRMVEEAIYLHPEVVEAAVVGVADAYRGQTIKACVVCREGARLDEAGLIAFLRDKLSPIEMPKQVEFRGALPKSPVGKVLKKELSRPVFEAEPA